MTQEEYIISLVKDCLVKIQDLEGCIQKLSQDIRELQSREEKDEDPWW